MLCVELEGLQHPTFHHLGHFGKDVEVVQTGEFFIIYLPSRASLNQRSEIFPPTRKTNLIGHWESFQQSSVVWVL